MATQIIDAPAAAAQKFKQQGWVCAPGMLDRNVATGLADRAQALMEADADAGPLHPFHGDKRDEKYKLVYVDRYGMTRADPSFLAAALSPRIGDMVASLLGVPAVRFLKDILLVKKGAAETLATPIHQDLPFWPIDRSAAVTVWIALREVTPAMGSIQFYDGSHRWGLVGSHLPPAPPLEARFPRLQAEAPSAPHHLEPGDATIHESMTLHLAAPNHTDSDRWGWAVSYIDADALYTGAPHPATDGLGLTPSKPLDHDRFPIVPRR